MEQVDFFIIGAAKCGTSALDSYLSKHPDIYMCPNEPNTFASDVDGVHHTSETEYFENFKGKDGLLKGDASPIYIFSQEAVPRILKHNPKAKLIALVRDPVTMAASWHNQMVKHLDEDITDFEQAWEMQDARKNGEHIPERCGGPVLLQYRDMCSIGTQLKNVLSIASREQVLILRQDEFLSDTRKTYLQVLEFLGLKDDGQTEFTQVNPSAKVKSDFVQRIVKGRYPLLKPLARFLFKFGLDPRTFLIRLNLKKSRVTLSPEFEQKLRKEFEGEVILLEEILGCDLSAWKPQ